MRIIYLHQYFNNLKGSGGTRSYEMARRLVRRGHSVEIVTTIRDDAANRDGRWRETEEDGIRVHRVPVPYSNDFSFPQRLRAFLVFAVRASARAAQLEGDVVFATSTPLTIVIPGAIAAWRRRIPMVFEVRDLWPELPIALGALQNPLIVALARMLERFAYRRSTRIVALSPTMKEGVEKVGFPADRIEVIPNASDIELFTVDPALGTAFRAKHEWLGERPLILYAGTLGRINGVEYLAHLAAAIRPLDSEVRFLCVGDGAEREHVGQEAERLGVLNETFFMIPALPKDKMPDVFSAADLCTSLFIDLREMWANSANKFFDALAAGRPVAINYGGWQAGVIREAGAGVILDPQDHTLAAQIVVDFLRDPARTAAARSAALHLARDRFSRDRLAADLERLLKAAVADFEGRDGRARRPGKVDS